MRGTGQKSRPRTCFSELGAHIAGASPSRTAMKGQRGAGAQDKEEVEQAVPKRGAEARGQRGRGASQEGAVRLKPSRCAWATEKAEKSSRSPMKEQQEIYARLRRSRRSTGQTPRRRDYVPPKTCAENLGLASQSEESRHYDSAKVARNRIQRLGQE